MAMYCMNCGVELPDGVSFCDACGTPVRGQAGGVASQQVAANGVGVAGAPPIGSMGAVACPVCGAAALPGEAFCDNCGTSLMPSGPLSSGQASPVTSQPPSYSSAPMNGYVPAPTSVPTSATQVGAQLVVTQPPPPATIPVPSRPELIVGRSDPQSNSYPDIDLGPYGGLDLGVSRRHFRLTRNGDQFYLEDLQSVNGCTVNGQRIPPYTLQPLRTGDRISLGKMEMRFEMG